MIIIITIIMIIMVIMITMVIPFIKMMLNGNSLYLTRGPM